METKDLKLTDEMKAELRDTEGFSVETPFLYAPKAFRVKDKDTEEFIIPKESWPRFILKSKDGLELARVEDEAGSGMTYDEKVKKIELPNVKSGTARIKILKTGILEVRNWEQANGDILSWKGTNGIGTLKIKNAKGEESERSTTPIVHLIGKMTVRLQRELQDAISDRLALTELELVGLE